MQNHIIIIDSTSN